ncbi:hypothetical protein M3Y99_01551900 [Aphelenchoides fujianensis]|nr:hypothetical protein M3Y99_01551900 [Aphelenchoides fujianensis]
MPAMRDSSPPSDNGRPSECPHRMQNESFRCSVCGIYAEKSSGRNLHEQKQHTFIRQELDAHMRNVIMIQNAQIAQLVNVGTALVDVQRTAVPSRDPQAGEYANEEALQAIVDADPQGASCRQ